MKTNEDSKIQEVTGTDSENFDKLKEMFLLLNQENTKLRELMKETMVELRKIGAGALALEGQVEQFRTQRDEAHDKLNQLRHLVGKAEAFRIDLIPISSVIKILHQH